MDLFEHQFVLFLQRFERERNPTEENQPKETTEQPPNEGLKIVDNGAEPELEEMSIEKHSPRIQKNETSDADMIDVNEKEPIISDDMVDTIGLKVGDNNVDEVLVNGMNSDKAADVSMDSDVDAQIEKFLLRATDSEGKSGWQCVKCNKYSKTKANLKKHVEIHLEGFSFPCEYCDKDFKTRNSLNHHIHTNKSCKSKRSSRQ